MRDTVRAYAIILDHGVAERPYNVCSGRAVPVREILDALVARSRVAVQVVIDPARYRPHDSPIVVGDSGRIRRELGWQPMLPIERTLDDLLEFWRARVAGP